MDLFKDRVITKGDWIIIGISLFLLVIISALYFVVVGVLNGQMENLNNQIADMQTKLSETRAIAAKKDGLLKDLQEVREEIASFESRLPTEK